MVGSAETISRCEEHAVLGGRPAEASRIVAGEQPGKCRHPSARPDPPERIAAVAHECFERLQITARDLLRLAPDRLTRSHRNLRENFARRAVRYGKVLARVPVRFETFPIALDDPAR